MKNLRLIPLIVFLFVIMSNKVYSGALYSDSRNSTNDFSELLYSPLTSAFSVWAPTAEKVRLYIYNNGESGEPEHTIYMNKSEGGYWSSSVRQNLNGKFYTFSILYNGKWLKETPGIFAKAVAVNGNRAAIIDMKTTDPTGWENDVKPYLGKFTDIIIYEMQHRDFSVSQNSGIINKGKFLALTENGTTNGMGFSTGIDHLKELGITHVHLMPSYDFGSIDETKLSENKYNWGYDPKNYNVPDGSFSTNPYNPSVRIREFKQMVLALHKNGIRVILDVVYNHTYVSDESNFSLTAPGYFYRHNADGSLSNASGCGNETASEKEKMRRFMIESVIYWVNEYHIDGFRFDLMGVHDIETMNQIRKELDKIDPTIFIYGEGWTAGNSPLAENLRAVKKNGLLMPRIAVFSDDLRDAVKGHWSEQKSAGLAGGKPGLEESVKFGIVGAIKHQQVDYSKVNYSDAPYANNPDEVINYVSCHDDMCLNDKLKASSEVNVTTDMLEHRNKLAQTIIFTSQGVPFMLSGEEIFRNKKGVQNSFESPDSVNRIDWSCKNKYPDVFAYYRELIRLRKNHPAFRMDKADDVRKNLTFIGTPEQCMVGFVLKNNANSDKWKNIIVFHNGNNHPVRVDLPEGNWNTVANDGIINSDGMGVISEGSVIVAASSSFIAFQ
jgi:pullulanase